MNEDFVDGNTLAGPLREFFAVDVTAATGRCAGCGREGEIATLRVYARAPGLVARCPSCDSVVLRLVRGRDRVWLDLRGTVYLEIPLADPGRR
jgi:Zn finger protein HypA/HybF involved in hydrogenase expression